jgi:hypothetical protein
MSYRWRKKTKKQAIICTVVDVAMTAFTRAIRSFDAIVSINFR